MIAEVVGVAFVLGVFRAASGRAALAAGSGLVEVTMPLSASR
jgi:hypothetical protein